MKLWDGVVKFSLILGKFNWTSCSRRRGITMGDTLANSHCRWRLRLGGQVPEVLELMTGNECWKAEKQIHVNLMASTSRQTLEMVFTSYTQVESWSIAHWVKQPGDKQRRVKSIYAELDGVDETQMHLFLFKTPKCEAHDEVFHYFLKLHQTLKLHRAHGAF